MIVIQFKLQMSDTEREAKDDSPRSLFKKKRRPSMGNPKIKPRQADGDHSSLELLAKQAEEQKMKQGEFGDPANEMFAPKNNFIMILLQQHMLSAGYEKSSSNLRGDFEAKVGHKIDKFVLPKTRHLKNAMFEALKSGNEKGFFESRELLHADLNYYQLDFELSIELEMKTRVYFALFFLINVESLRFDPDECKKRTNERMETLKAWFVEKGSTFLEDNDLKEYLKIPYLIESMPKDNELLNFVLSSDFVSQITEENKTEMEKVIFFSTEATRHRSFVTKIYEYFIKYHPSGSSSQLHESIYQQVENAIGKVTQESSKYQEEADELDRLLSKLTQLLEQTRSKFQNMLDEEKEKAKRITFSTAASLSVVQVNKECRGVNDLYASKWKEIGLLTNELKNITKTLEIVREGKNPDDLLPEGREIQLQYLERKQRYMILKIKMITLEMKKPDVPETNKGK